MEREKLIALAIKYKGNYRMLYEALRKGEDAPMPKDVAAITIFDKDYPKRLRELALPPLVLFYRGDRRLIKEEMVAVIGSRKMEDYASRATKDLVSSLKKRYTVISGLALGVDGMAHHCALTHKTIGVIGCGIDRIYPAANKELYEAMSKRHLIISEYPGDIAPRAEHFPFRNRIIAALATKVFVMQASLRSGTFITVNEAIELDREIYALPYDIYDEAGKGTNLLIEEGARMILPDEFDKY